MMESSRIYQYYDAKTLAWFDMLLEAILIVDEEIRIRYANPAYLSYSGLTREQVDGGYLPKLRPGSKTPLAFATKQPLYNVHRVFSNGSESYVDILPVLENEAVIGALIVVRDIKVLKKLFNRMKEKDSHISQLTQAIKEAYQVRYSFDDLIGSDDQLRELAQRAATTDSSVLLTGESGTGKEVLAQAIHSASPRRAHAFVDVNCAALPEELLESELFGYAPGAFTGANKDGKMGMFELADGGTIFLDEITEMKPPLQSKLLRVLQEKQVRRIGGTHNILLNVRVISATNQNIEQAIAEERLRSDLFYRLGVVIIRVPPLRERLHDLDAFIAHFMKPYEQKNKMQYHFTQQAIEIMRQYAWPGNIRQLQNAIEYICMVAIDGNVTTAMLPCYLLNHSTKRSVKELQHLRLQPKETLDEMMQRVEKEALNEMLERYGISTAAKKKIAAALGISLATLYNKLKRYGLLAKETESRSF